jgi:peroxisomal 2,4-dienoyl-CoA reductase
MPQPIDSVFKPDLLAGRTAIVTGGATGIGREICRVLGQHGARVAMISRKVEVLEATTAELRGEGIDAIHAVADVRDADAVGRAIGRVIDEFGRIDILVNNAAGNFPAPMTSISPNGFKAVVDIDLLGTYNVSKTVFESWMRENGGDIVNISAPFELRGVAMQAHVAAAKAGVDSLTRTCAVEWGPYGIRVNAVAPGSIAETEGVKRFADAVRDGDQRAVNPLGREGHGTDIAYAVLFFCSPAARLISGQVISVDGAAGVDHLKLNLGNR